MTKTISSGADKRRLGIATGPLCGQRATGAKQQRVAERAQASGA